jgi:hypothetical protein
MIMTGCARTTTHQNFTQSVLTLQDITDSFKTDGIILKEDTKSNYWTLNGVKPSDYQLPNGEGITIYIYKSGEDRESGLKDFNKQKEKYDMAVPSIYENRNLLMFYWYHGTTGSPTEYDKTIKKIITDINRKKPIRID